MSGSGINSRIPDQQLIVDENERMLIKVIQQTRKLKADQVFPNFNLTSGKTIEQLDKPSAYFVIKLIDFIKRKADERAFHQIIQINLDDVD